LDHAPAYKNVLISAILMRFSSNAVGQSWASKVEKKHKKRRQADASNKREKRFKWTRSSVEVPVNESSNDEN